MIEQQKGAPFKEEFIANAIKYILDKIFDRITDSISMQKLKKGLEDYLLYCYKRNIYINSLVLGNCNCSILDIYQPLTIHSVGYTLKKESFKIDSANITFLKKYKNVLLVDSAGMGKTTLLKYLSIQTLLNGDVIPILIELRNLGGEDIIEYIKKQIEPLQSEILSSDLKKVLKKGGFLIFFDGFDEIEDEYKKAVSSRIKELVNKTDKNYYIISSREEDGLYSFNEFQRFGIKPLSFGEAIALLRQLDDYGEISNLVIDKLKKDENLDNVKELLGNPLLISILYKTFECGNYEIPYKKSEFYNQVYYALYEKHDRTKDPTYVHKKRSGLDTADFNAVLRYLGFRCLEEKKIEYDKNEIMQIIGNILNEMRWLTTNKAYVLEDMQCAVPYLQEVGIHIKWIHKSFVEYFAAVYINRDVTEKWEIYDILYHKPAEYYNVLDFCYDLDVKCFRINIIYPFLEKIINNNEVYSSDLDVRTEDINWRRSFLLAYDARIIIFDETYLEMTDEQILDVVLHGSRYHINVVIRKHNMVLICRSKNEMLINLFMEKKVNIFAFKKDYEHNKGSYQIKDVDKGVYNIDFLYNNPLNEHDNFLSVNSILRSYVKIVNLDYKKCEKLYGEIQSEIKRENEVHKYNL